MASTSQKRETYGLSRGYAASARLDLQHFLWTRETGFLLHPAIPTPYSPNLKVADVGTGTAIWMLDLARQLPQSAQLDGFDISLDQCPPSVFLPPNVKCHKLDGFTQHLPEQFKGSYDIVNLRLFVFACPNGDAMPLLRNAVAMLKPGGWLQWSELDAFDGSHHITSEPDASKALEKFYEIRRYFLAAQSEAGTAATPIPLWIRHLDSHFKEVGLGEVASTRSPTSKSFLMVNSEIFWLTWEEMSRTLDPIGKGDRFRELIQEGYEESRRGNAVNVDRLTVVGRKPME